MSAHTAHVQGVNVTTLRTRARTFLRCQEKAFDIMRLRLRSSFVRTEEGGGGGKSLTAEQNETLRGALRQAVEKEGTIAAVAKKIGRAAPGLSNFLNGKTGSSMPVAHALATRVLGLPSGAHLLGMVEGYGDVTDPKERAKQAAMLLGFKDEDIKSGLSREANSNKPRTERDWMDMIELAERHRKNPPVRETVESLQPGRRARRGK